MLFSLRREWIKNGVDKGYDFMLYLFDGNDGNCLPAYCNTSSELVRKANHYIKDDIIELIEIINLKEE